MGPKKAKLYRTLRSKFQEQGDAAALEEGRTLVNDVQNLSLGDKERLYGYLEGGGRMILSEPEALLTETPKLVGLDGQKMSKSGNNTIMLREPPEAVTQKIRTMQTDPARVRRSDPGTPEKCPVWSLHLVYSSEETKQWAYNGCRTAGIGCLDCKQPVIDAINAELKPVRERAATFEEDPTLVRNIIQDGCEKASDLANDTMRDVREAMGLNYS
jgi:tryptophanyl-tRNA synthetase